MTAMVMIVWMAMGLSWGDTGVVVALDTADTGIAPTDPQETGETAPQETGETAPEETGETAPEETGETAPEDTAPAASSLVYGPSAASLSGETGGLGCSMVTSPVTSGLWALLLLLFSRRRRRTGPRRNEPYCSENPPERSGD